jgi:SAM-dependent methyltransferase
MHATAQIKTRPWARPEPQAGPSCICCGAGRWAEHFRVLRRCEGCGFIRADMDLTEDEVRRLYAEDYFHGKEYDDYLGEVDSHRKNFAYRFKLMRQIAPDVGRLFEVGCAYGFWLEHCTQMGVECAGVDVCPDVIRYAAQTLKQKAVAGDFVTMDLPAEHYQAFCLWDTIEHLAHPELFLARIHDLLPPGGWVFVTTGDIGAWSARRRGPRWRMIHPPTHLQYYSRATMRRFLERQGFAVAHEQSLSNCRTVSEIFGRLHTLGKGATRTVAGWLKSATPGPIGRLGIWLDLGDIMFVAARKV